jgi:hypothetical protein
MLLAKKKHKQKNKYYSQDKKDYYYTSRVVTSKEINNLAISVFGSLYKSSF